MIQPWMMQTISWFQSAAVILLISIFLWRRLWRELPFFFLYLLYAILGVGARYIGFYFFHQWYFYVYWISDLMASLLAFFPMYEVFLRRLFPKFYKTRFYRQIFPLAALFILVVAVFVAFQAKDRHAAFLMASKAFDFMRTAVLTFFIGLMLLMGRLWTRYDLGITLGFAIQASVALANAAVQLQIHRQPAVLGTAEIIAYAISCVIWLITFSKPEQRTHLGPDQLDSGTLRQARTWESMLKAWLTSKR